MNMEDFKLTRAEQTKLANSIYQLLKDGKATIKKYYSFDYDEYHIERLYKITLSEEPKYEFIAGFKYTDDYEDKLDDARCFADDFAEYPRGSYILRYHKQLLARGKPTLDKLGCYIEDLIQKDKPRPPVITPYNHIWF